MALDLSIIIINWNTRKLIKNCLHSIFDTTTGIDFEIIVVDNGSQDGSAEMIRRDFPTVRIISNSVNVGFVRANNQAIAECSGRYVLLLNSDTTVLTGTLITTLRFMDEHPGAGIAGVKILNTDGTFQASFSPFPTFFREFAVLSGLGRLMFRDSFPSYGPFSENGPQNVKGYVEGAYLMARSEALNQVGPLDEHIFMYAEEVDLCYRFHQAGWGIWYLPQVSITHHRGQSSKKMPGRMEAELYRSRIYFFYKHYGGYPASCLKLLVYAMTSIKIFLHKFLLFITNGKRGRTVASFKELSLALKNVSSDLEEKTAS